MIAHPEVLALRGDDTPQRLAQDSFQRTLDCWRARPDVAALLAELESFSAGTPLAMHPALADLFAEGGTAASALVAGFAQMACHTLANLPLAHLPLRHYTDGITSTLLIGRAVNVTLSLVAVDGGGLGDRLDIASAAFGPMQTWECVLGGHADVELVECTPTGPKQASLTRRICRIAPGDVMVREGDRQARLLRRIDGSLVTLRLQRRLANAGATREYDLASGALVHQAAGNPRDSRVELMMAMLGRMERSDAAPHLAGIALGEGSAALRWQALRECLALDTLRGFGALTTLAQRAADPLAGPAGALRAQLIEAHPALQELVPCRA